jgi:hypothetical protein
MTIGADVAASDFDAVKSQSSIERHLALEKSRETRRRITNRLLAVSFGLFVLLLWYVATKFPKFCGVLHSALPAGCCSASP